MNLTRSAVDRSKALILEHPKDPIVRVQVKDVDEQRLAFSITLEDRVQPDDQACSAVGRSVDNWRDEQDEAYKTEIIAGA